MKKKYKSNGQEIKLALIALAILFLIILFGKSVNLITQLSQPFNLSDAEKRQYELDSQTTTNIVFASLKNPSNPALFLVSLNPKEQQATILHISNDIYAELPKDLGSWRIGSVYQLGQENSPSNGVALLKISISKLVGLPIDGIIIKDDLADKKLSDVVQDLRRNPLVNFNFLTSIKSDLNLIETIKFMTSLSSIRGDKITSLDLAQSSITESKLLPDSTRVLGVDAIKLDTFIRDSMPDPNIVDESKTIAIYNATHHPGLAGEAARFVTNLGGNVVIVQTLSMLQEKSTVYLPDSTQSGLTSLRLSQFFAPQCIAKNCPFPDPKIQNSRAQINIVLGEDFYAKWHKR